jgi:hypothetical protein
MIVIKVKSESGKGYYLIIEEECWRVLGSAGEWKKIIEKADV